MATQGTSNGSSSLIYQITSTSSYSVFADPDTTPGSIGTLSLSPGLMQANDRSFYGLVTAGGAASYGAIYRVSSANGAFTILHRFDNISEGAYPRGWLVQGIDGGLYGTASTGGAFGNGQGTVFRATQDGTFQVLHAFTDNENINPQDELIAEDDGAFYGTTFGNSGVGNLGSVFRIDTAGNVATLYHFTAADQTGHPSVALLPTGTGLYYGTSGGNGLILLAAIFSVDQTGTYITLYTFPIQAHSISVHPSP